MLIKDSDYSILCNMNSMNDNIREDVRALFARRKLNQSEVAKEIGVSRAYLNAIINGKQGDMPDTWRSLLDFLGQEIVIVPKEKVSDVKRALVE